MDSKKEMKEYNLKEIANHNKKDDCWVALHGNVYDLT